jgi:beta-glucosidase
MKQVRAGRTVGVAAVIAVLALCTATAFGAQGRHAAAANEGLPYQNASLSTSQRVDDLLSRMTLDEKIGQMTQTERYQVYDNETPITTFKLGSILSGGGSTPAQNTPKAWADMIDRFQAAALKTRLQIPILYGIDSVHGDGNLLGATVFPHNIGLGATRDPALVRRVEHVTAEETRATGPQWTFAPCICAARDDRWGRTYESFGEDPKLVEQMETAIDGFQGNDLSKPDRVLATAKHFAGDGDTVYGTGNGDYTIDQGISITSHADFWKNALRQYQPAVQEHHVGAVMPSYSSVDWTEDGVGTNVLNMHEQKELISDVLKGQMGFGGFVISDWEGLNHNHGDRATQIQNGINAGIDMAMEPNNYQQFISILTAEVNAGQVQMSRINDAVRRILTKKFELGLFEHPFVDRRNIDQVGSAAHHAVARQAAAESQVLLKNDRSTLPAHRNDRVYVAGSNADSMGNQAGGWTIQWQGDSSNEIPGTTILDGIKGESSRVTYSKDASAPIPKDATGIVVVGETPYAEGFGDVGSPHPPVDDMKLTAADSAAVDKVCAQAKRCAMVVVSGRPLIIDPAQLKKMDALVAAWLPGSEGAGVSDTLFGRRAFTGKLPVTWPRTLAQEPINVGDAHYDPLFAFGYGLRTKAR